MAYQEGVGSIVFGSQEEIQGELERLWENRFGAQPHEHIQHAIVGLQMRAFSMQEFSGSKEEWQQLAGEFAQYYSVVGAFLGDKIAGTTPDQQLLNIWESSKRVIPPDIRQQVKDKLFKPGK